MLGRPLDLQLSAPDPVPDWIVDDLIERGALTWSHDSPIIHRLSKKPRRGGGRPRRDTEGVTSMQRDPSTQWGSRKHHPTPTLTPAQLQRFNAKYVVTDDGCWTWTGARNQAGYPRVTVNMRGYMAHRIAYAMAKGPIPDGLVIDHICCNTSCVNPDHLDAVAQGENVRRSGGVAAWCAIVTHCPQGHEYTSENTYYPPGGKGRHCRTCGRDRAREYQRRKRAASVQ